MNSQFGLANVWSQGDIVTKSVALLLLLMSLASWMVILIKTLALIKYKRLARSAEDFWHSEAFAAGLTKLGEEPGNPLSQLALEGREAAAHHRNTKAQLRDTLDMSDWVTRALRNALDEFPPGCNQAWPSWHRSGPRHRLWACLARSGGFTTRCWRLALQARPPLTKWRGRLARR
jgi:hypothetical protein